MPTIKEGIKKIFIEKECATGKNSKQAESPVCTKIEHTFAVPQSKTSQRTVALVVSKIGVL